MNAIIHETQVMYCDKCDKTINFNSRLRHINSESLKHKKYCTVVEEIELIKSKIHEVNSILNDTIKDC